MNIKDRFASEEEFEEAVVQLLISKKWEAEVLSYPSEQDLIDNWAKILFQNNRGIDCLGEFPLTNTEMEQILSEVKSLSSPCKLNQFINGRTVSIKRDNPEDKLHYGKTVSLKIYDRKEIAGGGSRYQIVRQPRYTKHCEHAGTRRGDLMLLINGMPVYHIELKNSDVCVGEATNQLEKYQKERIYRGIYSLVQIFVAMNPEEAVYFANPGEGRKYNKSFFFHWADVSNEPVNRWSDIVSQFLSIPMAHQMVGFYTIVDTTDDMLKVMRSYQYWAATKISDTVATTDWNDKGKLGGYIWHTTGSGKTITSFKSAQLIAQSGDADKVVFLMDRVELGTQSLTEYRGFAGDNIEVQATENTHILINKLKDDSYKNTLIVTSIQKMSNLDSEEDGVSSKDLDAIRKKRLVFIIDEAHRSTFGKMFEIIKKNFPKALAFGFTGTPIFDENQKNKATTSMIFGDELHRYTIADGIRDKNVLEFDKDKILTFKDVDIREAVALDKAKAHSKKELLNDEERLKIYKKYRYELDMWQVEKELPAAQYNEKHRRAVVDDIKDNWLMLSENKLFHALLATSSISDAISYFRILKEEIPEMRITALFDPNETNGDNWEEKQDGIEEVIDDYNNTFGTHFTQQTHALFKKDVSMRLSHKEPFTRLKKGDDRQLDLLIVVDQMLTGFDSKWLNVLYLDKVLKYEHIIQAFSRTNRVFGPQKPHGIIRYYRYPHAMDKYIEEAVAFYAGDRELDLFVNRLPYNIEQMNIRYKQISELFKESKIEDFARLPEDYAAQGMFAKFFSELNGFLQPAKLQGFTWDKQTYKYKDENKKDAVVSIDINEETYLILALRYKELAKSTGGGGGNTPSIGYPIETHITEIDTGKIDQKYMESKFHKFVRNLEQPNISEEELNDSIDQLRNELPKLSDDEQKYANIFIRDIARGDVKVESGRSFMYYINMYMHKAKDDNISALCSAFGIDESILREMLMDNLTEDSLNKNGRFTVLCNSIDISKAQAYFEKEGKAEVPPFLIQSEAVELIKQFILKGNIQIAIEERLVEYSNTNQAVNIAAEPPFAYQNQENK